MSKRKFDEEIYYICTDRYKELLNDNVEHCGSFSISLTDIGSCLESVLENKGENTPKRRLCWPEKEKRIIWHTHPYVSRGYPSREDIFKVVKNKHIEISIIFTSWGIWKISHYSSFPLPEYVLKTNENKDVCIKNCYYYNEMDKIEYYLSRATENGMVNKISTIDQRMAIRDYKRKVMNLFPDLKIDLTEWDAVFKNKYPLN